MHVSVVICTWNRAKILAAAIEEMAKLRIPAGTEWELLVVNNNSTDDTDEVIARCAPHLPIRRLFEPKQGLSHARNCALEAMQGELVLWTDDDVLVEPDWLAEYVKAAEAHPEAAFFGGTIAALYTTKPPRWIKRNRLAFLGAYALKEPPADIMIDQIDSDIPIGANMALRTDAFGDFRFDPNLGRRGELLISGEEEQLFKRLLHQSRFGVWVAAARVRHCIPAERLTWRYLWNYYHAFGESQVRLQKLADNVERTSLRQDYRRELMRTLLLLPYRDLQWAAAFQSAAIAKGKLDALRTRQRPA